MSDDFDKEAEREKLRKRFEQDKAERESTQRMSDLLLKGATMTNKHCNECGDPVFRQNDQEFCPTCQREVAGQDADQGDDTGNKQAEAGAHQGAGTDEQAAEQEAANTPETASGQPEQPGKAGDADPGQQPASQGSSSRQPAERQSASQGSTEQQLPPHQTGQQPSTQQPSGQQPSTQQPTNQQPSTQQPSGQQPTNQQPPRQPAGTQPQPRGSVGGARARLAEAIETHAGRAVETEEPGAATEHLEAAREAAEALAALRRSQ